MSDSVTRLTAVFAKRPEAGRVKTRLVPPLSPAQAAELAEAMLADLCRRLGGGEFRLAVAGAPAAELGWFRARLPDVAELFAQKGAGLGQRLAAFFAERLAAEPGISVVVVGADAPLASVERVERAHAALEGGAELVIGPDQGGGYDLIGLTREVPRLFTGVRMSSQGMCAATVELARQLGLRTVVLEPGFDVDVAADLERLERELARLDQRAPEYPRETAFWVQRWRRP